MAIRVSEQALCTPVFCGFGTCTHAHGHVWRSAGDALGSGAPFNRKCAFDAMDYGLGVSANSLELVSRVQSTYRFTLVQAAGCVCLECGSKVQRAGHVQGCDCLGTIKYWDGVLTNTKGEPMVIKKAICMHEEDYGARP
jgi:Cu2+-containing amine oxidase